MKEKFSKILYELDWFQFWLIVISAFLMGGVLSYSVFGISNNNIYQRIYNKIVDLDYKSASDFLSLSAKVLGTFVAIAVPISLNIVSTNLKTYKDKWISEMFRAEWAYKGQFYIVIPTIAYIFILKFIDCIHPFFMIIAFICFFISLALFVKFIKLIEKYSTQTDDIILERAKKRINEILD